MLVLTTINIDYCYTSIVQLAYTYVLRLNFISGLAPLAHGYISASLTVQKGAFEQRVSSRLSMMSVQMRTIGTISNGCSTC